MKTQASFGVLAVTASLALAALALLSASASSAPIGTATPTCTDLDGDGYGLGCGPGSDCNDRDPAVHPGSVETCDFKDNDCNGLVDDTNGCTLLPLDASPVHVPAGTFRMGSDAGAADERPVHPVANAAFALDRYEVTNARYLACVRAGACARPSLASSNLRARYLDDATFADYPVIFVSWAQAQAFCAFAGGRLPTEAEWEHAAAGAEPRTYPWGEEPPDCSRANFAGCAGDTDRVGRRPSGQSPYGAFDMAGNVWEWTADWYDANYYRQSPGQDPTGPASGTLKVMRGGCWVSGASTLRTTCRKASLPESWAPNVGFRCAYPESRP